MHVHSRFCQSKPIAFLPFSCTILSLRAKQTSLVQTNLKLWSNGQQKSATCFATLLRNELKLKQYYAFYYPRSKPVLQQISRLLQVARILSSDWLELHGSLAINIIFVTCFKTIVCLGPVKRVTCADFAAENRTSLNFL